MFKHSSELKDRQSLETLLSNQEANTSLKKLDALLLSQAALVEAVKAIQQELIKPDKKYVYGIQGLADLCHCSRLTAQRIKDSGIIDDAIAQFERTIIIDADLAIELLKGRRTCVRRR